MGMAAMNGTSGALGGAAAGSYFGPPGMVVGAIVGGIAGYATSPDEERIARLDVARATAAASVANSQRRSKRAKKRIAHEMDQRSNSRMLVYAGIAAVAVLVLWRL